MTSELSGSLGAATGVLHALALRAAVRGARATVGRSLVRAGAGFGTRLGLVALALLVAALSGQLLSAALGWLGAFSIACAVLTRRWA